MILGQLRMGARQAKNAPLGVGLLVAYCSCFGSYFSKSTNPRVHCTFAYVSFFLHLSHNCFSSAVFSAIVPLYIFLRSQLPPYLTAKKRLLTAECGWSYNRLKQKKKTSYNSEVVTYINKSDEKIREIKRVRICLLTFYGQKMPHRVSPVFCEIVFLQNWPYKQF